jgi:GNAT superfamily N-acetyltransferase
VITPREDGYEIDTSPERLDLARLHRWLSTDAYWALGRSLEVVQRAVAGSICFGVYDPAGELVAFCRVVTDGATFGWLCDVYVDRAHRGRGLGTWLAKVAHDHTFDLGIYRMLLATADAHGVYAKIGFTPLLRPQRWMEIDLRPSSDPADIPPAYESADPGDLAHK